MLLDRLIRSTSLRAEGPSLRDLDFILRPLAVFYGSGREGFYVGKMIPAVVWNIQGRDDGPALRKDQVDGDKGTP